MPPGRAGWRTPVSRRWVQLGSGEQGEGPLGPDQTMSLEGEGEAEAAVAAGLLLRPHLLSVLPASAPEPLLRLLRLPPLPCPP